MLKATLIGNLGNDAEVREFGDRKVISFNVAHNQRYRDRDTQEWRDKTVWVRCSYWRDPDKLGVLPYLVKGKSVYIEGSLTVGSYTNQEGQMVPTIDVRVQELQLVGGASQQSNQSQQATTSYATTQTSHTVAEPQHAEDYAHTEELDDLPF